MSAGTDFRAIVLAMAQERPNARVSTIVALALAVEAHATKPDLNDPHSLGRWASTRPEVAAPLAEDKWIQAIKELRMISGASLKQAKDAIDTVRGAAS